MSILQLLASRNYITVNKDLIRIIGLEEAIILGELASEHNYYNDRNELEDGYFYSTINNKEDNTSLNEYKQRKAINTLKDKKIIDVQIKGIPAKRYIKLDEEQVLNLLNIKFCNNLRTSSLKFKELEPKNLRGNNNIINKNKNNKYNIYGEFQNVKLTDEEYNKLKQRDLLPYIEKLSTYMESKGKRYKSHYATILTWDRKETKDLPKWFNKEHKEEKLTIDEQKELENILKEMESE